jgi:hypothetical protein
LFRHTSAPADVVVWIGHPAAAEDRAPVVLGDSAAAGHRAGDLLGLAAPAGDQAPVVLGDTAAAGHRASFLLICAAPAGDRAGLVLGDPAAAEHRAPRRVAGPENANGPEIPLPAAPATG